MADPEEFALSFLPFQRNRLRRIGQKDSKSSGLPTLFDGEMVNPVDRVSGQTRASPKKWFVDGFQSTQPATRIPTCDSTDLSI